jgi:hypothetical protein
VEATGLTALLFNLAYGDVGRLSCFAALRYGIR